MAWTLMWRARLTCTDATRHARPRGRAYKAHAAHVAQVARTRGRRPHGYTRFMRMPVWGTDVSFSCVVKTQRQWSKKIYKTELTKTRYNNQVLGKYRVDPQRAGLTLIAELTLSNLGLRGVLNKGK